MAHLECATTAESFVAKGGKVAILDLESSDGKAVAEQLGGTFHPCNVMDHEGMDGGHGRGSRGARRPGLLRQHGRRRRGDPHPGRNGEMHPLDVFKRVIDLNLIASFNINRIAAMHMAKNEPNEDGERGVMINTASIAAFEGQVGQVSYTAAKAGIAGMTLTIARDLGAVGVRCMTIAPSLFSTGLTAGIPDAAADNLTKDAAFPRRMGVPHEFATMAIAIFECPMMNGSTMRVDGGQRFAPK